MPDIKMRQKNEKRGRRAEFFAALWLQVQGWQIIARRARTGAGEIDLVVRRGRVLAFVEVKARNTIEQGLNAVTPYQQKRLVRAGAVWRSTHPRFAPLQPRYDLIVIMPWRWPRHVPAAFQAEGRAAMDLM